MSEQWDNGSWKITGNGDYVHIEGPWSQEATVVGGDFESMLSCLCNAYYEGTKDGEMRPNG